MQCSSATSTRRIRPLITIVTELSLILAALCTSITSPVDIWFLYALRRYINESCQKTTQSFNYTRNFVNISPITQNNFDTTKRDRHISQVLREEIQQTEQQGLSSIHARNSLFKLPIKLPNTTLFQNIYRTVHCTHVYELYSTTMFSNLSRRQQAL